MINININGVSYSGNDLSIENGEITINSFKANKHKDEKVINIVVHGDIKNLKVDTCKSLKVDGHVTDITTVSGDVACKGEVKGNITTTSGDIQCGNVEGNVKTISGDVSSGGIFGDVNTVNGKIRNISGINNATFN